MNYISVPRALCATGLNGYSDEGQAAKEAFHREGVKFLSALAKALGLKAGTYDVRSNKAGMAVSGEVTLHSDDLYLQLSESCMGPGVKAMYRTCDSRKDCCGHQNHFADIEKFKGADAQKQLVDQLRRMVEQVQAKKVAA